MGSAMYFTAQELNLIISWAIMRTAVSLGIISSDEEPPTADIIEQIALVKGHRETIDKFARAYGEWYQFHLEIYKAGKAGNLSAGEISRLAQLIESRDRARQELVAITATEASR